MTYCGSVVGITTHLTESVDVPFHQLEIFHPFLIFRRHGDLRMGGDDYYHGHTHYCHSLLRPTTPL